jgi:DNA-binding transcriptional MerR regulator
MLFFLKRAAFFFVDNWRIVVPVVAVLIVAVFVFRGCGGRKGIDIEKIEKINSENAAERKKELQEVIEKNAEVVQTVDERTTIAETNVVERDRLIDEKVKEVDAKIAEAKKQGRDVTQEELECMLVPENCK